MDRLGRSAKDLLNIVSEMEERGVNLEIVEQRIDTKTPEGKMFFTMVAAFAEFEHSMMVARTKDGLAAARARGRLGGRKPKLTELQVKEIQKLYRAKEHTVQEISLMFNVSRPTIYRVVDTLPEESGYKFKPE
jgi:DNA invertase Pin-like site-specific DNA recombinase